MNEELLNPDGSLKDEIKPAAYFDSCVLIDYWLAYERPDEQFEDYGIDVNNDAYDSDFDGWSWRWQSVLASLNLTDSKIDTIKAIRKTLIKNNKIKCIITPLALSELAKWYTEERFKRILLHSYQAKKVSSFGEPPISGLF